MISLLKCNLKKNEEEFEFREINWRVNPGIAIMKPMVYAELVREFNFIINCYYFANYSRNKFSCLKLSKFRLFRISCAQISLLLLSWIILFHSRMFHAIFIRELTFTPTATRISKYSMFHTDEMSGVWCLTCQK